MSKSVDREKTMKDKTEKTEEVKENPRKERLKRKEEVLKKVDALAEKLMKEWTPATCQYIFDEDDIIEICYRVREVFMNEKVYIDITAPVRVVGDLHGQFEDLKAIFDIHGHPSENKYIFMGDYVDRGPYGLEVVLLLFCYKIRYTHQFIMLRGNHESRPVNMMYGFYKECTERFSKQVFETVNWVFYCMPLVARVSHRVLCMHGGISEDLLVLTQLNKVERPCDIPDLGIIADLTWADPEATIEKYEDSPRGAARVFGGEALDDFCQRLKIDFIIRAHQVAEDGFDIFKPQNKKYANKQQLATIFSAPKYCGSYDNFAAVALIAKDLKVSFAVHKPGSGIKKKKDKEKEKEKEKDS